MTEEEKLAKVDQIVKEEVHNQTDAHGVLFASMAGALVRGTLTDEHLPFAQALFNKVNTRCKEEIGD